MMGRRRRTPEPASWAEMIREYQNEKRTVGAANVENVSVRNAQARALRFEQQSEYDPVCHRFRDPVKEKAVLDEERRKSIKMMNGGLVGIFCAQETSLGSSIFDRTRPEHRRRVMI